MMVGLWCLSVQAATPLNKFAEFTDPDDAKKDRSELIRLGTREDCNFDGTWFTYLASLPRVHFNAMTALTLGFNPELLQRCHAIDTRPQSSSLQSLL